MKTQQENVTRLVPTKFSLQDVGDFRRLEEHLTGLQDLLVTCRIVNATIGDLNRHAGRFRFERNVENATRFEQMHDDIRSFARELMLIEQGMGELPVASLAKEASALQAKILNEEVQLLPWADDHAALLRSLMSAAEQVWHGVRPGDSEAEDLGMDRVDALESISAVLRKTRKKLRRRRAPETVSRRARLLLQNWTMLFRELKAGHSDDGSIDESLTYFRRRFEKLAAKLNPRKR